jgi:hypothetical protein
MIPNTERNDVPKPPSVMIAFSLPHSGQDEDNLNRERGGDSNDGDIAEQAIMGIVECLNDRGPGAVARIRQYAQALEGMADAWMEKDNQALEDHAADAHEALSKLIS